MTGRVQVQGKRIEDWNTHEFPVLLECVNKLSDIKHFAGISSTPDQYQSILASSLHNFFVNFILFFAEEEIPSFNCNTTDDLSQEKITSKATSLSVPDVQFPVGELEAEFTQFQLKWLPPATYSSWKTVQQDSLLKLQRNTIDDLPSDLSPHARR